MAIPPYDGSLTQDYNRPSKLYFLYGKLLKEG